MLLPLLQQNLQTIYPLGVTVAGNGSRFGKRLRGRLGGQKATPKPQRIEIAAALMTSSWSLAPSVRRVRRVLVPTAQKIPWLMPTRMRRESTRRELRATPMMYRKATWERPVTVTVVIRQVRARAPRMLAALSMFQPTARRRQRLAARVQAASPVSPVARVKRA